MKNTNKKIYTKLEFAISPTSLIASSTEEKDIKDYLTNIVYGKNKINCNFDITSMLIDLLGPIEGLPQELNIQLEMNVNENVVNEVIFDFTYARVFFWVEFNISFCISCDFLAIFKMLLLKSMK